jgi:hypothetical protein
MDNNTASGAVKTQAANSWFLFCHNKDLLLQETRDKKLETSGGSACGAHFNLALLMSLVSLFVILFFVQPQQTGR